MLTNCLAHRPTVGLVVWAQPTELNLLSAIRPASVQAVDLKDMSGIEAASMGFATSVFLVMRHNLHDTWHMQRLCFRQLHGTTAMKADVPHWHSHAPGSSWHVQAGAEQGQQRELGWHC